MLNAATTCASAGIIVGVVTLTGLGLKFSSIVLDYAGGSLLLTALYTALIVWIVGLAVPVTASYIICAVIAAPALTKLGVPDYAAHMFIFYYAVLSEVSPPTALSPFAAAAITGGDPYITTMQAWKYTLPAFLVPFVFILDPDGVGLLMKIPQGGSIFDIIIITLKTAAGLGALAAAAQNWALRKNTPRERLLWLLAGLLLVFPSLLEALAERMSGYDVPHPAPFGLAIAAAGAAQAISDDKPAAGCQRLGHVELSREDVNVCSQHSVGRSCCGSGACWRAPRWRSRRPSRSAPAAPAASTIRSAAASPTCSRKPCLACRRPPKSPAGRSTISS